MIDGCYVIDINICEKHAYLFSVESFDLICQLRLRILREIILATFKKHQIHTIDIFGLQLFDVCYMLLNELFEPGKTDYRVLLGHDFFNKVTLSPPIESFLELSLAFLEFFICVQLWVVIEECHQTDWDILGVNLSVWIKNNSFSSMLFLFLLLNQESSKLKSLIRRESKLVLENFLQLEDLDVLVLSELSFKYHILYLI